MDYHQREQIIRRASDELPCPLPRDPGEELDRAEHEDDTLSDCDDCGKPLYCLRDIKAGKHLSGCNL